MGWGTWLLALVGPLAQRALVYLGFVALSMSGVTAAVDLLVAQLDAAWQGLPASVLSLVSLAHVPQGLGLVVGAHLARIALWAQINGTRLVYKGRS